MHSIIFLFTSDMLKVFSLVSNHPSSLKCWHVDGVINQMTWFLHGHVSPVTCDFRDWNKHRASYILCKALCKMKMGILWSKCIKIFRMATAEHEVKSWGPFESWPHVTAEITHTEGGPGWQMGGSGARHTVILLEKYVASQFGNWFCFYSEKITLNYRINLWVALLQPQRSFYRMSTWSLVQSFPGCQVCDPGTRVTFIQTWK